MCVYDYIPFTQCLEGKKETIVFDFKTIAQGLIIAAVTGLLVMYGTQKSIMVELDAIRSDVREIHENQIEFRKDFYMPRHAENSR